GKHIESKGWSKLESQVKADKAVTVKPAAGFWDTDYELIVNLEIREINGGRVNRPYIAVWIEDENKKPVRNIAVWYNKGRYLEELRSWDRTNGSTFQDQSSKMGSISSATRPPGKYTLKWDGKDDSGTLVKAGKYTVYIEAAREHGTHQLMSQEMNFASTANQLNLTGNVEIASSSLDYRKKSAAR
ncbi:MAG TPA: DUF2271 domain-containing protein, partial [Sphingobacteriaceae bacterium]|nr:DUF2271 domain-containing protein [Sphingobacteriaceae bacterium]